MASEIVFVERTTKRARLFAPPPSPPYTTVPNIFPPPQNHSAPPYYLNRPGVPTPRMVPNPVPYYPTQNQGFNLANSNPNPRHDVHRPPITARASPVPVQGFILTNPNPNKRRYGDVDRVPIMARASPVLNQDSRYQQRQGFYPPPQPGVPVQNTNGRLFTTSTVINPQHAPPPNFVSPYGTVTNPTVSQTRNPSTVRVNELSSSILSELFRSINAQEGLANPKEEEKPVEEEVPSEFDAAWLKVRHESVIKSLYSDIPRQCKTCGQRFKTQEEHSKHMDRHVRKNRELKKIKKMKPSRPWLLTQSLWLKAIETPENGGIPFFLRQRDSTDEKVIKEFAVPADENQTLCALCMEGFEDFYSDETEDWMYRGTVYKNDPNGSMAAAGKDRSKLGPIVHAKCL
ncbi:hypothetical protein CCACVL1_22462 [Corchorus capsularis]|uniref:C2H2-type domain-containing protein n=1 Tax=Corchorus capsularis TaxID=210143 RepID=A0A1R3GYQ5_COCAP|nr:hypothetical protein CCACVL1_22462 [Corchorus capsularis]